MYICALMLGIWALSSLLPNAISDTSVAFLLILLIISTAYFWGTIISLLAAILSFLYFDYFHLAPIYSLAIEGMQRLITFAVFVITALVVSQLMSHLKNAYQKTQQKQIRTDNLYRLAKLVAQCDQLDILLKSALTLIEEIFHLPMMLWLAENDQPILKASLPVDLPADHKLTAAVKWSWQNKTSCGSSTETLSDMGWYILPLQASDIFLGVMAIQVPRNHTFFQVDQQHLFQSLLDQLGVGIYKMQLEVLREKTQVLAETDKLRRALLTSVSHDLRTPLASIIGSLTSYLSLEEKLAAQSKKELLVTVLEESERLNKYIGNLLILTKVEAGALQLNCHWSEMTDIINHAVHVTRKQLAHHRLVLNFAEQLPLVWMDEVLTEQVFINILENSAKYSSVNTQITITVHASADYLTVDIADQGRGLATADLKRIFDLFYRVEQLNDSAVGSGMGLAICKSILLAEHATIEAQSAGSNLGSVFIVHFYKIKNKEDTYL